MSILVRARRETSACCFFKVRDTPNTGVQRTWSAHANYTMIAYQKVVRLWNNNWLCVAQTAQLR